MRDAGLLRVSLSCEKHGSTERCRNTKNTNHTLLSIISGDLQQEKEAQSGLLATVPAIAAHRELRRVRHAHTHRHRHTHTHTHTRTHTHTHTHTHTDSRAHTHTRALSRAHTLSHAT